VDFVWRAQEAGFVVRWCPEAVVTHAWGGASDERRRAFRYGVGRARLLRKHRRWRNLLGDDRATAFYALVLLGLPFVFVAPWYLAVLVLPLWRHRQHRPFATVAYGLVNAAGFLRELVRR
jgi:GT2 family glycosyltransferase